jgi:hypothetical protein
MYEANALLTKKEETNKATGNLLSILYSPIEKCDFIIPYTCCSHNISHKKSPGINRGLLI